ncbi:MAG: von Willebrand factor type A domain-containing protein [Alphaproteobacteria bacterium]|nr:von Willebrand factor type A domain-containing protein [Alphaproteobacteria bacterium]MBO6864689.1 von Willebrand factor type A domain-containing protein [Alphaproteobacteria bacterium]
MDSRMSYLSAAALIAATVLTACGQAQPQMAGEARTASVPPPTSSPAPLGVAGAITGPAPVLLQSPSAIGQHPTYEVGVVKSVAEEPFSTFSLEVDTASYSVVRRYLRNGTLPPPEAVRVEEMLNYFDYDYPGPETREEGFRPTVSLYPAPWKPDWALLRVGVKAFVPSPEDRKPLNLVLLVDRSGSMQGSDRLKLVQKVVGDFLSTLRDDDRVGLMTYANGVSVHAEPTTDHKSVAAALRGLDAGGGTAGGAALEKAYALAQSVYDPAAENRILLITDGDFNVGIRNPKELERYVDRKRQTGFGLSVLGVGQGNFNDSLVQAIVQAGNGVAAYMDSPVEGARLFADGAAGLLHTVAADVKVQVEFNPAQIAEYRLIGYETRALETRDFLDSGKDAGEVNAGRSVTALYEVLPVAAASRTLPVPRYDGNRPAPAPEPETALNAEWAEVKIAFKPDGPDGAQTVIRHPVSPDLLRDLSAIGPDDALAAAIAGFAGKLRRDPAFDAYDYDAIKDLIAIARARDEDGWRSELLHLVSAAESLDG